ncbi:MAG TPA: hypothetical protein VLN59_18455, partial [Burkholderiales bacterium]|nr:hypothetical protein [Burkholderiales bacterium]
MYKLQIRHLTLAVLCALPLLVGAQEGLKLRSQPTLTLTPPDTQEEGPLYIEADRIYGHSEKETEAEGDVRLRKPGKAFFADWMRYDKDEDLLNAAGHVRIEQGGDTVVGERLRYELNTERGEMDKPVYHLRAREAAPITPLPTSPRGPSFGSLDGRGDAERLIFRGPGEYRAERGGYTTCGPGNDDWFIRARVLDIDRNRDVGVARDARIVFLDHTIFYTPYMSFSLHQERKSGFLPPHYGSSNTSGVELTVPYYWNIAPNM